MNILPKKRWHVRTKENIERVRKDEEQAANEEKERLRRIALAESEARTDVLRVKARKRQRNEDVIREDAVAEASTSSGHINFFEDIEKGEKLKKTNDEYEEEKKQEKEKQEKAIGLLTYLGQSAVEAQNEKPWYFEPPKKKKKSEKDKSEEFDTKNKMRHDPMHDMMKLVETTRKVEERRDPEFRYRQKEKKSHKHKHKKHKRRESENSSDLKPKSSGKKTIEQLRAERLKREQEERRKTHELLARVHGGRHLEKEVTDEREMGYNSQYNPSLARKKKPRPEDEFD